MFAAGQQPGMQFPLAPTRDPTQANSDMAGVRTAPTESPDRGGRRPNNSACFNCRLARQRCDRQTPCSRCVSQQRTCLYPARSNRGRKQGSTNKPDTVEKLLSRISESPVCDQVVAAILDSAKTSGTNSVSLLVSPRAARTHAANATRDIPTPTTETSSSPNGLLHPPKPRDQRLAEATQAVAEIDLHGHLVSPLHILAAAVGVDTNPSQDCECPNERPCFHKQVSWNKLADPVDERVSKYFAPQATHRTDWQALASQSVDSTMRLEPSACDPVTARLIDETDAALYFSLFFEIRQPFACLLDPELHTPEQVYSRSFTLFSVICAMGCAVSVRPRDRILYPALLSMAENSMKWAIASAVKCLAVIQSIIIMQYWAPLCPRQSDDPSWLRFGHAIRLAKELGINNSATIKERVDMLCPDGSDDFKARLTRNFERAWLHTFVTDKGLSMITGRSSCLSWKQIPRAVGDWWRDPNATIYDRLISGCSEMRRLLTHVLGQGKRSERTSSAISAWHSQALRALEQLRSARCTPDEHPSATLLPILGFNMDHSILILNAQASRDLVNVDEAVTSEKFMKISLKTVEVAERMLNALLSERVIVDRVVGLHNNQCIAICHAMTEIMSAIDRGGLKQEDVDRSASTVRLIPKHLEKVAQGLPSSSVVHLYVSLSRFFAKQLDRLQAADAGGGGAPGRAANEPDRAPGEWWKAIDDGAIDFGTWLNMGFLSTPDNGAPFMEGMEETDESFFNDLSGF